MMGYFLKRITVPVFYCHRTNDHKFHDLKRHTFIISRFLLACRSGVWPLAQQGSLLDRSAITESIRAVALSRSWDPLLSSCGCWPNSIPCGCMTKSLHHKNHALIYLFSQLPSRGVGNENTRRGQKSRRNCYHSSGASVLQCC